MNSSAKKAAAIVALVIAILIAIFSFKATVIDPGSTAAAHDELEQQHKNAAGRAEVPAPRDAPATTGLRQPGNKGMH